MKNENIFTLAVRGLIGNNSGISGEIDDKTNEVHLRVDVTESIPGSKRWQKLEDLADNVQDVANTLGIETKRGGFPTADVDPDGWVENVVIRVNKKKV